MKKNKRIAGIIPARWSSTRFPGKMMADLAGRPVIHRTVERVQQADQLDEVIVATDHTDIQAYLSQQGIRCVMTDPALPSGTDRVAVAARALDVDGVINIQGDEPFIEPGLIDRLATVLREEDEVSMVTACVPLQDEEEIANPSVVKVVLNRMGDALYFSRSVIPFIRDETDYDSGRESYKKHLGIYGYQCSFLFNLVQQPPCLLEKLEKLEQLRALDMGARIRVIETNTAGIGIDDPEDLVKANERWESE